MLSKKHRLADSREFKHVYRKGYKVRGKYGMLIGLKYSSPTQSGPKFGFVVSKKIGNAVNRHLLTRRLRGIAKEVVDSQILNNKDIKFQYVAFEYCDDYQALKKEFIWQVKKILKR